MSDARRILRGISRTTLGNRNMRKGILQLHQHNKAISNSLASAFDAILERDIPAEEKAWIEKIELLRKQLLRSSTEISIVDYGAGLPSFDLAPKEMYHGRKVTATISDVCRTASLPPAWGFLLFKLVRQVRPSVCLELGTSLGISTAYQAAALELNQHGKIATCEGDESLASLAKENFERLGLRNVLVRVGRFQDVLGNVLREIEHLDFAFIDGHHEEQATLAYFRQMYPFFTENSIIVVDDISWSEGMRRAWNLIAADKRTEISIDLCRTGICTIASSPVEKMSIKMPLD